MGRAKAKIPDRWENYSPIGKRITDTRFVSCKCPLKEELCRKLPSKNSWFTPNCLFRLMTEKGQAPGLVIDLTNTDRYYNPDSFTFAGVEYAKIFTPGHDVPGDEAIIMFREVIEAYERKYANKDLLIVVHCTHGVNRTGYQICHYLIQTCGWSFEKAVQAFNVARGHSIERENYLEALKLLENKISKIRLGIKSGEEFENRRRRFSSTSSSSDSEKADQQQSGRESTSSVNAAFASGTPATAQISASGSTVPPPLPNVFPAPLMQQMLMGVAQMQAFFSQFSQQQRATASLTTYTPSINPSSLSDDLPTSSNLALKEDNEDQEEAEEGSSSSSSTNEEEEGHGNQEISGSASGTPNPDWELGGKVQRLVKTSAQKRRERQKRLQEMHRKMQRGKFWEIREMQKEKYGF